MKTVSVTKWHHCPNSYAVWLSKVNFCVTKMFGHISGLPFNMKFINTQSMKTVSVTKWHHSPNLYAVWRSKVKSCVTKRSHINHKIWGLIAPILRQTLVCDKIDACHKIRALMPINWYHFWGALYWSFTVQALYICYQHNKWCTLQLITIKYFIMHSW